MSALWRTRHTAVTTKKHSMSGSMTTHSPQEFLTRRKVVRYGYTCHTFYCHHQQPYDLTWHRHREARFVSSSSSAPWKWRHPVCCLHFVASKCVELPLHFLQRSFNRYKFKTNLLPWSKAVGYELDDTTDLHQIMRSLGRQ